MKVIILAGGWGTRLGKESDHIPKPMVQIGNRPILWHIMKIFSFYGLNDFIISLGVKAHIIKHFFLEYDTYARDFTIDMKTRNVRFHPNADHVDWTVTLIDTGLNTLKGARIKRTEKYLADDINMITYGDGVADIDIPKLIEFHKSHGKTLTITGVRPPSRFGEIIASKGRVIAFEEKPQTSVGLINGGFMVFNRNLLDYLDDDESCDFEKGPLNRLTRENEVMVYEHTGKWECMDHQRDVKHLNKLWDEDKAFWKVWE